MTAHSHRTFRTREGKEYELPLFMPVYQTNSALVEVETMIRTCDIDAMIVNAYFLYKDREMRQRFNDGLTLREYVGFDGLLMTDSGAFQGFARKLFLDNKKIIKFQDQIQTDVSSPLDLVTPPGDSRAVAEKKMISTLKRIEKGIPHTKHSLLAGVQQGGRFLDLRKINIERLVEFGCQYIALGSLVPFFTGHHDLTFVGEVIRDARQIAGPDVTMHVYGAGDPVDLPIMAALGADIFDSSSYAHYARRGAYMTPYGAIKDASLLESGDFVCECETCQAASHPGEILQNENDLAAHNVWTICMTVRRIRELLASGQLNSWIDDMLPIHQTWFPDSRLANSWSQLNG